MGTELTVLGISGDDTEFRSLPQTQRDRVWRWGFALSEFYASKAKRTGPNGRYSLLASKMGLKSQNRVARIIRDWEQSHDWHVLLDGRYRNGKGPENAGAHCARFQSWVIYMAEHECRSDAEAIRKIHMIFHYGGMEIPGFERHLPGKIPPGCSHRALARIISHHRKEVMRARFGVSTSRNLPVLKTRSMLEPGMLYEFDDVIHDHETMYNKESVRMAELGILDYASACRIYWGNIPRFRREDDHKRQSLTRKMALMMLAYLLRYIGVHPDKCVIMMEHGSATLSDPKIAILNGYFGDKLDIRKGGIEGRDQRYLGGRVARGKGNPKAKAGIENSHALIHTSMGNLPAQTGWTGRNEPAITWKLRKESEQVALWQDILTTHGRDDLASTLDQPTMRYMEFIEYLTIKYALINGRTDHNLEGWERRTTLEYNIADGLWIDSHDLDQDPVQRDLLKMLITRNPRIVRERRLSPTEVWAQGRQNLVRIPLSVYVDLIGDDADFGRTVKVRDGMIKVEDKMINNGIPSYYIAETQIDGEPTRPLHDRREYRVVINPYATEELVVLDDAGRILGLAPLHVRVNPLSEDLYKTIGKVEARKARDQAQQRARWSAESTYNEDRLDRNRDIAAEGGITRPLRNNRNLPRPKPSPILADADNLPADPVAPISRVILEDADDSLDWDND